jgi:WD40 repeat protein
LDKIVRVWDISKKKVTDYINVKDLITSIVFFPDGNQIAVGFHNGKVSTFDLFVK